MVARVNAHSAGFAETPDRHRRRDLPGAAICGSAGATALLPGADDVRMEHVVMATADSRRSAG
jgi:hypothetical protein